MEHQLDFDLALLFPGARRNGDRTEVITDCPYCGKKGHLYINALTKLWECKRCKEAGNAYRLLEKLGRIDLLPEKRFDPEDLLIPISQKEEPDLVLKHPSRFHRPVGFQRLAAHPYLRSRGFTEFERYEVGVCRFNRALRDRVVFVVEPDARGCAGYVARTFKAGDRRPKYYNQPGADFDCVLYGAEEASDQTKTVILVEGVFDKLQVDRALGLQPFGDILCFATMGNKVSEHQMLRLINIGVENVFLIYDRDAVYQLKRFSLKMASYFNVFVNHSRSKDPGDSEPEEILDLIEKAVTPIEYQIDAVGSRLV